jgi:hypothetical protein
MERLPGAIVVLGWGCPQSVLPPERICKLGGSRPTAASDVERAKVHMHADDR